MAAASGPCSQELRERGLVEEPHGLSHGAVLGGGAGEPVLAAVGVDVLRLHARRGEPVGALPAGDHAEGGAARGQPIVQHRAPHVARGVRLAEGPVHRVEEPDHLAGALAQVGGVALERHEAPDVHVPEIHGRLAAHDPLRQRLAGAGRRGDADGVEAGRHEVVPALGRLAEHVAVVGREALGAVHVPAHRRRLDGRDAHTGLLHQEAEVLPVLRQQRELEVDRDAVHPPRLGHGLEAAHEQAADLLPHVDVAVGVAQHGEIARDAGHRLGDDVEVLGGVQRHVDAGHPPDLAPPHAGAVHDHLAGDVAAVGADAGGGAARPPHARHGDVLDDGGAAQARAPRQRQRGVDRVRPPVAGDPHGAGQVVGPHQGPEAARPRPAR